MGGLTFELSGPLVESRERLVRRFQAFTMAWPWAWTPEQAETWSGSGGWAYSTIRSYQGALAVFLDYVCDKPVRLAGGVRAAGGCQAGAGLPRVPQTLSSRDFHAITASPKAPEACARIAPGRARHGR